MISTSAAVISCGLYEKELSERHALRRQKNHFRAASENFPITVLLLHAVHRVSCESGNEKKVLEKAKREGA